MGKSDCAYLFFTPKYSTDNQEYCNNRKSIAVISKNQLNNHCNRIRFAIQHYFFAGFFPASNKPIGEAGETAKYVSLSTIKAPALIAM